MPHRTPSVTPTHISVDRSQHLPRAGIAAQDVHAPHLHGDQTASTRCGLALGQNKPVRGFVGHPLLQISAGVHLDLVGRVPLNPHSQPRPVPVALGSAGAGQRVGFVDVIGLNGLRNTAATQQGRNSQHAGAKGGFVHAAIVMQGAA